MSEPARAAKPVNDALAEGRRRTGGSRRHVAPAGLGGLQRAAGNAAVNALIAGRLKFPGAEAVKDIDARLRELRRDEPAIDTVEKGLKRAKAAGVPVELEGPKPPPSALAVTKTGFGPASVAAKKPVPPPKPVPKGKSARQGRGQARQDRWWRPVRIVSSAERLACSPPPRIRHHRPSSTRPANAAAFCVSPDGSDPPHQPGIGVHVVERDLLPVHVQPAHDRHWDLLKLQKNL